MMIARGELDVGIKRVLRPSDHVHLDSCPYGDYNHFVGVMFAEQSRPERKERNSEGRRDSLGTIFQRVAYRPAECPRGKPSA
jgi:hypothetical protein